MAAIAAILCYVRHVCREEIDAFALFCPDSDTVYYVLASEVPIRARSSSGQSHALLTRWVGVRVPPGPPKFLRKHHPAQPSTLFPVKRVGGPR